ncbi:MAG: hypothetical protein ABI467_18035 [Kofleriaceae bacterium]
MRSVHLVSFTLLAGLAGCPALVDVPCNSDTDCDLASGGKCVAALSGQTWCAFPDTACDTGLRYSDDNVGDGVGGTCTGAGSGSGTTPPGKAKLTVTIAGTGAGSVTSAPAGISCTAGTCSGLFDQGTQVTLTQTAATGAFVGWIDACTGKDTCSVTLAKDTSVGALFGDPGELLWAKRFGGTGVDAALAVASTSDSNVIVVGRFAGTVPFDAVMLSTPSDQIPNMFVAKLDGVTGAVLWARSYPAEYATNVAVDTDDNIYVAAAFEGSIDFGVGMPLTSAGLVDVVIAKLSPTGDPVWTLGIGGPNNDAALSLVVRDDHVAIAGTHTGVIIGTRTYPTAGGVDIFLADLHLDGAIRWSKSFGGAGDETTGGAVLDSHDDLFVTGGFSQAVNFGTGSTVPIGATDLYLAEFDPFQGNTMLAQHFGGGSSTALGQRIALDATDDVFVGGEFSGTVDFGGGHTGTSSGSLPFAAKYSSSGVNAWVQPAQASGFTSVTTAITTHSGDLLYAGSFCGNITFDVSYNSSHGCFQPVRYEAYAAQLGTTSGTATSSMYIGGTAGDSLLGLDELADLRRYGAGFFAGAVNIGPMQLTTAGVNDALVFGLAPR